MKKAQSTTKEERLQIVRECLKSGRNYGEMALKYNVSYQQVRTWTLRFEELGEAGLEDRRGKRRKDQTPRRVADAGQMGYQKGVEEGSQPSDGPSPERGNKLSE